ncbi:T6SS effector BTH_I2691 family protein [Vibrio sp. YMD68]|uniref:T6SS effector BTH_I2691 family protein n=1 Tax=Vibrio sp. YMD68 TaxID=3042300 RepID=UPI00249C0292|nr:T6SS effector BTH_I2691 family protein [Vibrio sp. YMD68]WGW00132.1 T6SS effector BTH_I2691 family protein [Vibrio sp. YMD68]
MSTPNKVAKCASTHNAKSSSAFCPFQSNEIGIIPVRYAFDDMNEQGHPLHPLPETDTQWQGRLAPKQRQYTLRQLRDGWLYVYDETDKTFHEYQVKGYEFTKFDWSADEADKPANERGSEGETKSCLVYPAKNTLSMTFAHQRWTWRLCEHMRSHASHRSTWMRKVNLKQFQSTLSHPHAGPSTELGQYVADIGIGSAPTDIFDGTCTPLTPVEGGIDDFKHVADKAGCWDLDYRADLPAQDCGMFIALDDPLADVTDLFLPLAEEVTLRNTVHQDEDNLHKLQMAELTRTLGRVRVEDDDLPEQVKGDPTKGMAFERQLTDYLATQYLADKERTALEANPNVGNAPLTLLQEEALEKLSELQETYRFTPTDKQQEHWQRNTVFSDEVNWDELDAFLTQYYTQVKGLDERIDVLYQDFMTAFEQLGTDPLPLGLDNQDEAHLAYLLSLTSQYLAVVKQAVTTEQANEQLKQSLSLDSPKTLFALASLGFKLENWQALNAYVDELGNTLLSMDNSSDMVTVSGAIANWGGFTGDVRMHEKAWFKALTEPVQLSFTALQNAVSGQAHDSWRAISNFLFPSQMNTTDTIEGLISNLRLVTLEAIVNPEAIVVHNPDYPAQLAAWQRKLNTEMATIRRINQLPSGSVTPKNHQIQTMRSAQQKMQKLLSSELPMMVMLKHEAVNNTAKQMLNDAIERSWQQGKQFTQASWEKLGKMGGVVAILNLWNMSVVLQNIRLKTAQHPESDLWTNPAIREATYATGYAVSAVAAVWRDAKWDILAKDSELLKKSLNIAIKEEGTSKAAALKTFAKTTAAVSLFGLIATGLETWESGEKAWDSSHSPMERLGYGLKGGATAAQSVAFLLQFRANILSRFGTTSIGATIAPWMLTTLMVAGIVYLIGVVIINVFKRSELDKWLLHSTWGKESKQWNAIEELTHLERIIHKPQVQLNSIPNRTPAQWMDSGTNQWQLEITLPAFTKGQSIGLQITRKPKEKTYSYGSTEEQSAVMMNEQNGTWRQDKEEGSPVIYRLDLGGTTDDTITVLVSMPFNWQADEHQQLGYVASGSRQGDLTVEPAPKEFATRIIEVRLDK